MIITTNNGGGYDGSKGYYLWASGEKGLISGCTGEKSNGYQAGGVPLGEWSFPNLKIPPQTPRLHYFQTKQFWR